MNPKTNRPTCSKVNSKLFVISLAGIITSVITSNVYAASPTNPQAAPPTVQPVPEPELIINSAKPPSPLLEEQQNDKPQPETQNDTIIADEQLLLNNPKLLNHALNSATATNNLAGIRALLPIYRQLPKSEQDQTLVNYSQALIALDDGDNKTAIKHLRALIAEFPEFTVVRFHLARALFFDKQNEAAKDQFDKLQSENLPNNIADIVKQYQTALLKRDTWQWQAGFNVNKERNINNAPKQQKIGNWEFEPPIDATALTYQLGGDKKWSLPRGFYIGAGGAINGKNYLNHKNYNDHWGRANVTLGFADAKTDVNIAPFAERRFFGNDLYSTSRGVRLSADYWLSPKTQTLNAIETTALKITSGRAPTATACFIAPRFCTNPTPRAILYWGLMCITTKCQRTTAIIFGVPACAPRGGKNGAMGCLRVLI